MHNPIRTKWSLDLVALASMPHGTNAYHCADVLGGTRKRATYTLSDLHISGHLHVVPADRSTGRLNQYFTKGQDAVAWKLSSQKKNAAFRDRADAAKKNHKQGAGIAPPRIQTKTWARTPMPGTNVKPSKVETHGLALGFDCRYQMAPKAAAEFVGEFGREWKILRGEK